MYVQYNDDTSRSCDVNHHSCLAFLLLRLSLLLSVGYKTKKEFPAIFRSDVSFLLDAEFRFAILAVAGDRQAFKSVPT
jgi:hypothetical protein